MATNINLEGTPISKLPRESNPAGVDVSGVKSGQTVKVSLDTLVKKTELDTLATKTELDNLENRTQTKIENIENNRKGYFSTDTQLKAAHPTPQVGWYAYVGSTGTIWEESGGNWVDSGDQIPDDVDFSNVATKDEIAQLAGNIFGGENMLNNDLDSFILNLRVGDGGYLVSNSTALSIVSCKPIAVEKNKSYKVAGALYKYSGGIRGAFSKTSTFSIGDSIFMAEWEEVIDGWKVTSPVDGYFIADFELNSSLTALKTPSTIVEFTAAMDKRLRPELLEPVRVEIVSIGAKIKEVEGGVQGKADSIDLFEINLLDNGLTSFHLDKRLTDIGNYTPNTGYERLVANMPIQVKKGVAYVITGSLYDHPGVRGAFSDKTTFLSNTTVIKADLQKNNNGWITTSPIDGYFTAVFELNNELTALQSPSSIIEFVPETGKVLRPVLLQPVHDEISSVKKKVGDVENELSDIVVVESFNKINPENIKFDRRYSTSGKNIQKADANPIASSGLIPVTEGEWYTIGGSGIYPYQGGYFGVTATDSIGQSAIDNISFVVPVSGDGRCFQIPTGKGVKYVLISLLTNSDHTALAGNAQMEVGEMATEFRPYKIVKQINPVLLLENPTPAPSGNFDVLTKYTEFGLLNYNGLSDKIANFRKHWILKDKNLCVVNTGTSLTARSIEHCTDHRNAKFRPPLMHSNNFATHIWDALRWEGQQYRRYDSGFFTEVGTWLLASNIAEWDDGSYRSGLTRYSDNLNSQLSFVVPLKAWQFNFIFRTDSVGSENCVIAIAEGNGKMEVLDETGQWIEANGYMFSQKESSVYNLSNVTFIQPENGQPKTYGTYQTKGNTTYQKRLYMRCKSGIIDSRDVEKTITITRTSGRLMYWGVEWSDREFMITYVNAARGSHNSAISSSENALNHYQDNEIWSFKPDLILSEDPIHNSGGSSVPNVSRPTLYYGIVTDNFFFADNPVSLKQRCTDLGLDVPEFVLFNTTITWNFGGINNDGELILGQTSDGYMWTALDSQNSCYQYISEKYPDVVYINAVKNFVKACYDCYGNMKDATVGSGKGGKTFTNEGSHWNDTGCRVMARVVLPILDFTV